MTIILLAGLRAVPMMLLYVACFCLGLAILYWILSAFEPSSPYARRITLIVGAFALLIFLIQLAGGGSSWRM